MLEKLLLFCQQVAYDVITGKMVIDNTIMCSIVPVMLHILFEPIHKVKRIMKTLKGTMMFMVSVSVLLLAFLQPPKSIYSLPLKTSMELK
jgi:hypothetical protein